MGALDLVKKLFGGTAGAAVTPPTISRPENSPTHRPQSVPASAEKLADLTMIRGVGEGTVANLRAAGYGNVQAIAEASKRDLLAVPGVGPTTAARLKAYAAGDPEPAASTPKTALDPDGQAHRAFNASRRIDRGIHEMLGLCRGLLADGIVTADEALMLSNWLEANGEAAGQWPANAVAERFDRIFADGVVDSEEQEELAQLLREVTGTIEEGEQAVGRSSTLPLTDPRPALEFKGWQYVFTGRFASGTRRWCQQTVERLGAATTSDVTLSTNVLVIGTYGSRDWAHSSFGRKIQKAMEYQQRGHSVLIVDEAHWSRHLS